MGLIGKGLDPYGQQILGLEIASPDDIDRARHAVAAHSVDAAECRTFLDMLGLLDVEGER